MLERQICKEKKRKRERKDGLIFAINVIYQIHKVKNKYYMINSIDTEVAFNKIPYHFMLETLSNISRGGIY